MKSIKPVLPLEEISLPFKITFPETISGGVNNDWFQFPKDTQAILTFPIYEALLNSSYGHYLKD